MALPITITDAGRAEIINAQNTGTGPVTITEIGFGTGQYTPMKTRTALQAQVKRVSSIAGQAVAADTIHVMALDESSSSYNVGEFGLFSDKGTLIAVYSQPAASGWIIQKAGPSTLLLATDIILESLNATSITFGDISFINPPATTTVQGVVELATPEETQTGTDASRAVTPAGLKSLTGSTTRAGLVQLNNTLTSTSTSQALTAAQGKKLQAEKLPLTGGTLTGPLNAGTNSVTGNLKHSAGYFEIRPFDASYDDGSYVRMYWDGITRTLKCIQSGAGSGRYSMSGVDIIGNASTATRLETPRNISGVPFDGTKDIDLSAEAVGAPPTSRQVIAGNGLAGGGALSADRTLSLGTPGTLSGNTANAVSETSHTHALDAATESLKGVVELATAAETQGGADGTRAVTPAGLKTLTASTSRAGLVQLNDTLTSTSTSQALTAAQGKKLQDEKLSVTGGTLTGPLNAGENTLTGNLKHSVGYFEVRPYNASYDDGSFLRMYWDGVARTLKCSMAGTGAGARYSMSGVDIIGNASTASRLETPRSISGVPFDGSADISLTAEHIGAPPTSRQVLAGSGLTGGGALSADRTVSLGTPGSLSGNTSNAVTATSHTHAISAATDALRGVIELATAAEVAAGDSTRAVTGATLIAGMLGLGSMGGSGYITIPYRDSTGVKREFIFQWTTTGTVSSTMTPADVTWPTAYPTACLGAACLDYGTSLSTVKSWKVISDGLDKVGAKVMFANDAGSGDGYGRVFSWGY